MELQKEVSGNFVLGLLIAAILGGWLAFGSIPESARAWLSIIVLFGSWIGWFVYSNSKKWSAMVGLGGGFIVACLMLIATILPMQYFEKETGVRLNIRTEGIAETDKPLVARAVKAFTEQCPDLVRLADDIKDAKATWAYPGNTGNLQHGWRKPVELIVQFNQSPLDKRLVEWRAFGHTCYYTMGGGLEPGWNTGKEPCARVCGVAVNHGVELFTEVRQMQFLDDPNTQEYQQALVKSKSQWEADIAKEMAGAKKGDQDSISNVGYLWGSGALGVKGDSYNECVWRTVSYLKMRYEVSSDIVRSASQRKQMEAEYIEGKRKTARDICVRHLPPEQVWAAVDEADQIADTLPGRRPIRRAVLDDSNLVR